MPARLSPDFRPQYHQLHRVGRPGAWRSLVGAVVLLVLVFVLFPAVAGGLIASSQSFQPYIGFDFVIVMYAGVVLGGMGSILGAFWGGLTIGLVQQMSTLVLPYQLQNTAIFVVFLLIIFFRPQGMFGRVSERT